MDLIEQICTFLCQYLTHIYQERRLQLRDASQHKQHEVTADIAQRAAANAARVVADETAAYNLARGADLAAGNDEDDAQQAPEESEKKGPKRSARIAARVTPAPTPDPVETVGWYDSITTGKSPQLVVNGKKPKDKKRIGLIKQLTEQLKNLAKLEAKDDIQIFRQSSERLPLTLSGIPELAALLNCSLALFSNHYFPTSTLSPPAYMRLFQTMVTELYNNYMIQFKNAQRQGNYERVLTQLIKQQKELHTDAQAICKALTKLFQKDATIEIFGKIIGHLANLRGILKEEVGMALALSQERSLLREAQTVIDQIHGEQGRLSFYLVVLKMQGALREYCNASMTVLRTLLSATPDFKTFIDRKLHSYGYTESREAGPEPGPHDTSSESDTSLHRNDNVSTNRENLDNSGNSDDFATVDEYVNSHHFQSAFDHTHRRSQTDQHSYRDTSTPIDKSRSQRTGHVSFNDKVQQGPQGDPGMDQQDPHNQGGHASGGASGTHPDIRDRPPFDPFQSAPGMQRNDPNAQRQPPPASQERIPGSTRNLFETPGIGTWYRDPAHQRYAGSGQGQPQPGPQGQPQPPPPPGHQPPSANNVNYDTFQLDQMRKRLAEEQREFEKVQRNLLKYR